MDILLDILKRTDANRKCEDDRGWEEDFAAADSKRMKLGEASVLVDQRAAPVTPPRGPVTSEVPTTPVKRQIKRQVARSQIKRQIKIKMKRLVVRSQIKIKRHIKRSRPKRQGPRDKVQDPLFRAGSHRGKRLWSRPKTS
jgi:hypothetical protein